VTRAANTLGILAAALLFLGMLAPLFGGALSLTRWGTQFSCGKCGWEGEWEGSICPRCGK
jgi:hypothetical protein